MMKSSRLSILYKDAAGKEKVRCLVEKWEFHDKAMSVGEQYLQFGISSEVPIAFAIGDFCTYRGQKFYLNNIPSVSQTAKPKRTGDAFKYENVRFDSVSTDLGRVIMLDITPTTGDYIAAVGTNYTGSSNFQLYCGETKAIVLGKSIIYTPVCTLAGKIQANLDRAFPKDGWHIHVNLTSTKDKNGIAQLVTHSDDKILSFNNTTVAAALSEVQTTFKLDYFIKGRDIYIGYTLGAITGDNSTIDANSGDNGYFYFGYGKGYADADHQGKSLFEIKKTANQSQQIITRLRAMGSIKNMPYRYYNKEYNLSQSLFPQNLQLPDTFEKPEVKAKNNIARKRQFPFLRAVLGDTNDAYIDKNDDCMSSIEGLREGVGLWDGSNQDLEEIYPTIKEATYGELRGAFCEDMNGFTEKKGTTPDGRNHKSFTNYDDLERIDEILAVGYLDKYGNLIDNANTGDGIMPQEGAKNYPYQDFNAVISLSTVGKYSMYQSGIYYSTGEKTLFTIQEQNAGSYFMAASFGHVWCGIKLLNSNLSLVNVGYRMKVYVKPKSTLREILVGTYLSPKFLSAKTEESQYVEFELPSLPDVKELEPQIESITLTEKSDVRVTFEVLVEKGDIGTNNFDLEYFVGNSSNKPETRTDYKSQYRWAEWHYYDNFVNTPFNVIIKDLGIKDFKAQFNGNDKPTLVMSDGYCVAREFEIGDNVKKVKVTKDGRIYWGWQLSLTRASDTSLHTYYPNASNKIQAGDHYVLLGIVMPSVYIKAAEQRLLVAATQYLKDNCETKYTYEPHLDDIYLARNYDRCEEAGDVTKSVYWNLYAGLRFPFFGIPETPNEDEILPIINITIESLTIKEGEGITPKVELTLNDKIQQSTYQKITTAIDRIYNGSLFAQLGISEGMSASDVSMLIKRIGDASYLSKTSPDVAKEIITFLKGLSFGSSYGIDADAKATLLSIITQTLLSPNFDPITESGFGITQRKDGKYQLSITDLVVWGKAIFNELDVRKLSYVGGNMVFSACGSKIRKVVLLDENGKEVKRKTRLLTTQGRFLPANNTVLSHTTEANLSSASVYRCYFFQDDGTMATTNLWQVGDQARMQVSNIKEGRYAGVGNRRYWRLVKAVGEDYIDLSISDCEEGSDVPQAGDSLVQFGSRTNTDRMGLIYVVVNGDEAPAIIWYDRVNSYTLEGRMTSIVSPRKVIFSTQLFKLVNYDGTITPMTIDCGEWSSSKTYYNHNRVSYDGRLWLCIAPEGVAVTEKPSSSSDKWLLQVDRGGEAIVVQVSVASGSIRNGAGAVILKAAIYKGTEDITATIPISAISWERVSSYPTSDTAWNNAHKGIGPNVTITAADAAGGANFNCLYIEP